MLYCYLCIRGIYSLVEKEGRVGIRRWRVILEIYIMGIGEMVFWEGNLRNILEEYLFMFGVEK